MTFFAQGTKYMFRFFKEVAGGMAEFDSPFDTLATLSEVKQSPEDC